LQFISSPFLKKLLETFGDKPPIPSKKGEEINCKEREQQILAFFSYLENKDYVKSYKWKGGIHKWFQKVVKELSRNQPVVSGETNDLYSLLKNMAHFYRVSGKKGIKFVKDILLYESSIIEPTSALFYEWFISGDHCVDDIGIRPSRKAIYSYAGFFLNTLAGRSYLLRRNSKIRILVTYYSVLIIHKSNEDRKNEYGIDIRPYIDRLLDDVFSQKVLIYRMHYLKRLEDLRKHYEKK